MHALYNVIRTGGRGSGAYEHWAWTLTTNAVPLYPRITSLKTQEVSISMPIIAKRLVTILGRLLVLGALATFYLWLYYNSPTAREGPTQLVSILPGMGLKTIATTLEQAHLIRHRWMFILYVVRPASWPLSPGWRIRPTGNDVTSPDRAYPPQWQSCPASP